MISNALCDCFCSFAPIGRGLGACIPGALPRAKLLTDFQPVFFIPSFGCLAINKKSRGLGDSGFFMICRDGLFLQHFALTLDDVDTGEGRGGHLLTLEIVDGGGTGGHAVVQALDGGAAVGEEEADGIGAG